MFTPWYLLSELINYSDIPDHCSVVYCAKNRLNGKCYVGKTKGSFRMRMRGHVHDAQTDHDKFAFHAAIRKHGTGAFDVCVLEKLEPDMLSEREIHFIKELNTCGPSGYNMTLGGEGICGFKHNEQTRAAISKKRRGVPMSEEQKRNLEKSVLQINLITSEVVKEYESIGHALVETRINNIGKCCRGELPSAGGFGWKYVNVIDTTRGSWSEEKRQAMKLRLSKKNPLHRPVEQLDKDGSIVNTFSSIKEAHETTGINNISMVCRGVRRNAGGYKWRYVGF